jgi:hypothetical protein
LLLFYYHQRKYNEEEPARTKKITPSISDLLKKLIVVLVNKNVLTQIRKKNVRKNDTKPISLRIFFGSLRQEKSRFKFHFTTQFWIFRFFVILELGLWGYDGINALFINSRKTWEFYENFSNNFNILFWINGCGFLFWFLLWIFFFVKIKKISLLNQFK